MLPGDEAGTLGAAAELAGATVVLEAEDAAEPAALAPCGVAPQAVNSTAIAASDAQAATCRGLGAFVIPMMSNPFNVISGSASHVTYTTLTAPPWLNQVGAGLLPRSVRNKYQRRDR